MSLTRAARARIRVRVEELCVVDVAAAQARAYQTILAAVVVRQAAVLKALAIQVPIPAAATARQTAVLELLAIPVPIPVAATARQTAVSHTQD